MNQRSCLSAAAASTSKTLRDQSAAVLSTAYSSSPLPRGFLAIHSKVLLHKGVLSGIDPSFVGIVPKTGPFKLWNQLR